MSATIYLLPHQDDESFVIPRILMDVQLNRDVHFLFLTKNQSSILGATRIRESRRMLKLLGVSAVSIFDWGSELEIKDGFLCDSLGDVLEKWRFFSKERNFAGADLVCPAYEGGHQDHDAAYILSTIIAKELKSTIYEYFLYNGFGTHGKMYKVASPLQGGDYVFYPYSWKALWFLFLAPFIYSSQWKAMAGLWPFLFPKSFIKPLAMRKHHFSEIVDRVPQHTPLYERWGRITYAEFIRRTNFSIGKRRCLNGNDL